MSKKSHKTSPRPSQPSAARKPAGRPSLTPILLALIGIFIVIMVITLVKESSPAASPQPMVGASTAAAPSEQLEQALAQNRPVMVFMHSTDCIPCKEMTGIVEQVYPSFAQQVALVDVNVYDRANAALLQSLGLRVIPTSVFFDRQGQGRQVMGVIPPDELRSQLQALAGMP